MLTRVSTAILVVAVLLQCQLSSADDCRHANVIKVIDGDTIKVSCGGERMDKYGRRLAYVFLDREFINAEMGDMPSFIAASPLHIERSFSAMKRRQGNKGSAYGAHVK